MIHWLDKRDLDGVSYYLWRVRLARFTTKNRTEQKEVYYARET